MNGFVEWKAAFSVVQILLAVTAVIGTAMLISRFLLRQRPIASERLWLAALVGVLASPLVVVVNRYAPESVPGLALLSPELQRSAQAEGPNTVPFVQAPFVRVPRIKAPTGNAPAEEHAAAAVESAYPSSEQARDAILPPQDSTNVPVVARPVAVEPNASARPVAAISPSTIGSSTVALALRAIGFAWILGVLVFIVRAIRGAWICRRILMKSVPVDEVRFAGELLQLRHTLQMNTIPPIVVSACVGSPLVIGVVRPCIVLPLDGLEWMSSSQLFQILLHEAAHVVRKDAFVRMLQNLASGLFWPHPLVHWLNVWLSEAREDVCDNFVLAQCKPADYAETLLQMTERCPRRPLVSGALAMLPERGSLEARVARLLDVTRDLSIHWPLWRTWGIQSALLLVPLLMGLIRVTTRPAHAEEPARAAVQTNEVTNASNAAAPKATGRITGQVNRDKDGTTVAGAEVVLQFPSPPSHDDSAGPPPTRRTKSDPQGRFSFDELAAGGYRVWANSERLTSRKETLRGTKVVVPDGADAPKPIALRLVPGVAVTVRVKEKATGRPVPNATVNFGSYDPTRGNFRTDANGQVTARPLAVGHWKIAAWGEGFSQQRTWLHLVAGTDAELEFLLDPGADIVGVVRDPTGNPLANAELSVSREGGDGRVLVFVDSNEKGRYRLGNMPIDTSLHVSTHRVDYLRASFTVRPTESQQTQDFTLQPRRAGGTVYGTVVDEQGNPIAGALLRNAGAFPNSKDDEDDDYASYFETRETTSGPDGGFRLENLYNHILVGDSDSGPPLTVRAKNFAPQRLRIKVESVDNPVETKIVLKPGHRIHGRVTDDKQRPLEGVEVSSVDADQNRSVVMAKTGSNGEFALDSLAEDARFSFEKSGYEEIEKRELPFDSADAVAVEMTPASVILGKVIDSATGKPIRSFNVRMTGSLTEKPDLRNPRSMRTPSYLDYRYGQPFQSVDGTFELGELVAGSVWDLTIGDRDYSPRNTFSVRAARPGEAEVIEFKLDPVDPASLVTYSGRMLEFDRRPVQHAQLRLIVARDRIPVPDGGDSFPYSWTRIRTGQIEHFAQTNLLRFITATTDKEGRFEFTRIPRQAEVELVWWGNGVAPGRADHLDQRLAEAQGKPIEIILPRPARIKGHIDRQVFPTVEMVSTRSEDGAYGLRDGTELTPDQATFEIDGLAPGKYVVALMGPRDSPDGRRRPIRPLASKIITLGEGQTVELEFDK